MTENITQLTTELEQSKTREHLLGKELRTLQVRTKPSLILNYSTEIRYNNLNH